MLIDEPAKELVFGPNPGTVLTTTAGGGSTANLTYKVGTTTSTNPTIVDSGGVDGTLLQSAVPGGSSVPDGTEIAVSYNGIPLYSYTVEVIARRSSPRAARTPGMKPSRTCRYTSTTRTTPWFSISRWITFASGRGPRAVH